MASAIQAKQPERILILGEDLPDLSDLFEKYSHAKILHIRDRHALARQDVRDFDPEIVICSGECFRGVVKTTNVSPLAAPRLTKRQQELLPLIAKGLTNREVASIAGLSVRVVKSEVSSLLALYEVTNRTELAALEADY